MQVVLGVLGTYAEHTGGRYAGEVSLRTGEQNAPSSSYGKPYATENQAPQEPRSHQKTLLPPSATITISSTSDSSAKGQLGGSIIEHFHQHRQEARHAHAYL